MAIEKVVLHFTTGGKFEIRAHEIIAGNILTLPTKDLTSREYHLMLRWLIPNTDLEAATLIESGLAGGIGSD